MNWCTCSTEALFYGHNHTTNVLKRFVPLAIDTESRRIECLACLRMHEANLITGAEKCFQVPAASADRFVENITVFSAPFYMANGEFAISGLKNSDLQGPMVFFCGEPNGEIKAIGRNDWEAREKLIDAYSDCFVRANEGKVFMKIPTGVAYPEKNIATCRCSEAQVDAWFTRHACQNKDRFLRSEAIAKACKDLQR